MAKRTKAWLITAASLILIGCIIFGGLMMALNFNFSKLSTTNYETNTYLIEEDFQNITIKTGTADLKILPAEDGKCSVVCFEDSKFPHSVAVQDGNLLITKNENKKWYNSIGIVTHSPTITVYLPQAQYRALSVNITTGDVDISHNFSFADAEISLTTGKINLKNLGAENLSLSLTTGKANLANITCKALTSTGSTGDIKLENVIATEKLSIKRTTGDVTLTNCDAGEIYINVTTGSVTGSLLTEKVFTTKTTTGNIDVPNSNTGGKCEIKTTTGSIMITIGS